MYYLNEFQAPELSRHNFLFHRLKTVKLFNSYAVLLTFILIHVCLIFLEMLRVPTESLGKKDEFVRMRHDECGQHITHALTKLCVTMLVLSIHLKMDRNIEHVCVHRCVGDTCCATRISPTPVSTRLTVRLK
jgi:hypothetical protein